jgi:hypothetical protein
MKILSKSEHIDFSFKAYIKRIGKIVILSAILFCVYCFPQIFINERIADYYGKYIFTYVSYLPNAISDFFIFSLTELLVIIGSLILFFLLLFLLSRIIKKFKKWGIRRGLNYSGIILKKALALAIILMMIFQFMHGINYRRTGIAARMGLTTTREHTYEEYASALVWAYNGMIQARAEIGEDARGVGHMKTGFEECVYDANSLMDTISLIYDYDMSDNYIRAKGVMLSHYWSYTGITGVYDAFLGEANLNTDYIDVLYFPVTLCHEISHAKGYARENDANTAAILACIRSPRADFRYAGYYAIFTDLYYKTASYAEHEDYQMPIDLSDPSFEPVLRDMHASAAYSSSLADNPFTRIVDRFSESANNAFLEANGQKGGTDTYIVPASIYVDYYCTYVAGTGT